MWSPASSKFSGKLVALYMGGEWHREVVRSRVVMSEWDKVKGLSNLLQCCDVSRPVCNSCCDVVMRGVVVGSVMFLFSALRQIYLM